MRSIPFELYHLILEYLPLKALKICSLTNRALHELALPFLFYSVTLRDYFPSLLAQLTFFNGRNETQVTRSIRELHLNLYTISGNTAAASDFEIFFNNIALQLRVLDMGERRIHGKFGGSPSPKYCDTSRNLLVDFIPCTPSLVSITVGEESPIPLAELVTWCPSVRSITLIDPDTSLLRTSSCGNRGSIQNSLHNLQILALQCSHKGDWSSAVSTLTLVGQSISLADSSVSSAIRSLYLHGFDWLTKEDVFQFVDWLFSPRSLFENLHDIHFPPVVFQLMGETSSPVSLSSLPTLKTITFTIGTLNSDVTRQWPIFFEWLLQLLSAPHSLKKLAFEVLFNEYASDRDLMTMFGILDRNVDSLPELTFTLVVKGIKKSQVICGESFTKWLKYKLPALNASGKLHINLSVPRTFKWN
ncbi:hypothetical protein DL96DRAFT_1816681 [Flagelloscypha sp. PMI_526]|nr:hypothetical protein DL96DRAFT_1816681 [Flagelloscypha sp. PMI_526]